jgi:hypothetical protein
MRFLVLPLLALPIYAQTLGQPFGQLKEEQKFKDYTVRIYRNEQLPLDTDKNPDHQDGLGCFEILKAGRQVFFKTGVIFEVEHVVVEAGTNIGPAIMGQCILGDNQPCLAISGFNGGNNNCEDLYVFQIGDTFKPVATINTTGGGEFQALRRDGSLDLVTFERTLEGMCVCEADAVYAKIIFRYQNNRYQIDLAAMKRPAPDQQKLLKMAGKIKAAFANAFDGEIGGAPTVMKGRMLELIYSGNMESAWKLCELSWPTKSRGKDLFLKEFVEELKSSPHYNDINQASFQNGALHKS